MDNAQMTSQMAQINTVSGIQQLNQTMTSMAAQFGSMQALQGASLIGRQAMVAGSQPLVADGVAKGAFSLAGAADSVKVDVLGTSGAVLGTVTLGAQQAGQQFFEVPLTGIDPTKVAKFSVTATAQGKAVTATPISLQPVTSVAMANGTLKLTTSTGTSYTYDQVLGYR
jgi:flagellar basal-body rod modification protein FlgD